MGKRQKTTAGPRVELGALGGLIGFQLRRAQVAAFADFRATVGQGGITPGLAGTLALIEANPGLKQSALAARLGIDRSTLVPALDRLEARGLIVRRPMAGDRRAHALEFTEKGRAAWARTLSAIRAHEARLLRGLTAGERRTLIRLLGRIAPSNAPAPPGARGRHRRKP